MLKKAQESSIEPIVITGKKDGLWWETDMRFIVDAICNDVVDDDLTLNWAKLVTDNWNCNRTFVHLDPKRGKRITARWDFDPVGEDDAETNTQY